MSHIVKIQTEFKDAVAIEAACKRVGATWRGAGTYTLFRSSAAGLGVQLKGWEYPLVIDPMTGQVEHDNFGGMWGDTAELNGFKQAYTVEKARLEARKKGFRVTEQSLNDGSIKLTLYASGGE